MFKLIINIIGCFLVFASQVSFINALVYPLNKLNLIVILPVFLIVLLSRFWGVCWLIVLCLLAEFYSSFFIGVYTLALSLICLMIHLLSVKFLTNKSLFTTIILIVIAILSFFIITNVLEFLLYLIKVNEYFLWPTVGMIYGLFWELILAVIFVGFLFLTIDLTTHRFKTHFLR